MFIRQIDLGSRVIFFQTEDGGLDMVTGGIVSLNLSFHVKNVPYSVATILCSYFCIYPLEVRFHISKLDGSVSG